MEFITLLTSISQYGTAPALLVIVAILAFQNRQMSETKKEQKSEIDALKASLSTQFQETLAALAKKQDERHKEHESDISDLQERMGCVERDYVSREEHYRDLSGWREEIRQLGERINSFVITIMGHLGKDASK
jgi:hypothetical protein